jgi:hypothetical protein
MSGYDGPRINTNGLTFCVDAGDLNSYVGGLNLVNNGFGFSNNNTNFSQYTYDTTDKHGISGSFKYTGYTTGFSDAFITIDTNKNYVISMWVKAGNTGGVGYYTANYQYAGLACFDADYNYIANVYFQKYSGATDTTLATALNTGDTTITLTNGTGWATTGAQTYERQIQWWPYTNSFGYTYPDYTYTRYTSINNTYYSNNGCWSSRSGNVLTLTQAWPGPNLAIGTKVANGSAGGSYNYNVLANNAIPNTWTLYTGTISGIDTARTGDYNKFRPGSVYVKVLFLSNYPPTTSDAIIRYSDIIFRESRASTWYDLIGNKNGVLQNSVCFSTDKSSILFNGIDDYIGITDTISLGNTFTICAFIKLIANNSDTSIIGTDANGADNWLGINTNKIYALFTQTADVNNDSITGNTTLLNNKWYHVTITINTSTVNVYLNGVQDATPKTVAFTIGSWSGLFAIGRRSYYVAQRYFLGNIACIQGYNRVLTVNEIRDNFQAMKSRYGI